MQEYKLERVELNKDINEGVDYFVIVYSGTRFNGCVVEHSRVEFCITLKDIKDIPKSFFYKIDIYRYFGLEEFDDNCAEGFETMQKI